MRCRALPVLFFCIYALVVYAVCGACRAESAVDAASAAPSIESDLKAARETASRTDKRYREILHDVVYEDKTVRRLYDRVKELEQALADARNALNRKLEQLPQVREIQEQRRRAYERVEALRRRAAEQKASRDPHREAE
jgi:uncharacterized protein YoxC